MRKVLSSEAINKRNNLAAQITEQEHWMQKCGGTLEGYRTLYNDRHNSENGDAIFRADMAALDKLYEQYYALDDDYAKAIKVLGEDYFA